jgi:prophage regulatory protein
MARPPITPKSANVFEDLGIRQSHIELAKADLAIRIHRLAEHRRLNAGDVASLIGVPESQLAALFQGSLATCSLDQLLRMLTWLGDDVEILIRPRIQRTRRGALRVLQAAAVEKPDDFEPVRHGRGKRASTRPSATVGPDTADGNTAADVDRVPIATGDEGRLLDKHAVETMTSLDITTIYRKMSAGTFPQPVRVGRRRVAWRTSDILRWQQHLEVGTETVRWQEAILRGKDPASGRSRPRDRR